jgi:tetratricopeptide (TPR) repeat protein
LRKTDLLARQLARYRELNEALKCADTAVQRAQLGAAVARLYQQVEVAGAQLAELQEGLRGLVDRYGLDLETSAAASEGLAPTPPTQRTGELSELIHKGWTYIEDGDYDSAKDMLQRALSLAPSDAEALSSLGWAQTVSQDYDDALATYQQLQVVNPGDILTRVNLGYICLKKGIYGEAIEHLSKVIHGESDPGAVLYGNYYLGLVYMAREMYADAETFFQSTVTLNPRMSEAFFQLGRTRYLLQRKADAISAWKDGAVANQGDFWATRCNEAARAAESGGQPLLD